MTLSASSSTRGAMVVIVCLVKHNNRLCGANGRVVGDICGALAQDHIKIKKFGFAFFVPVK